MVQYFEYGSKYMSLKYSNATKAHRIENYFKVHLVMIIKIVSKCKIANAAKFDMFSNSIYFPYLLLFE